MTCQAELHIGDDYGDNHATMRCQLDEGHEGPHVERFRMLGGETGARDCRVSWVGDDRD